MRKAWNRCREGVGRRGQDTGRACKVLERFREGVELSRTWGSIGKAWEGVGKVRESIGG